MSTAVAPVSGSMNYRNISDLVLATGVVLILGIMMIPLPTFVLDLLLSTSLALSLVILLMTIYTPRPLSFSVFPTVLLLTTLFRLSLNVASTRVILLNGHGGKVIEAFGNFVVGGNFAVGIVAFTILSVIQFVVITKGAGRIAEVAARFMLDGMPGKQMAIDADLNAGLIDEMEAKKRREEISSQADFYGAMDGASKFVRGDAVAGLIITLINVAGGFLIGVLQMKMSLADSARTFTLLTVGDGLMAQVPALIVSTAAGLLVTRADRESKLGEQIGRQLGSQPNAILSAAAVIGVLGLVPGLPTIAFLTLAGITAAIGLAARTAAAQAEAAPVAGKDKAEDEKPEEVERFLSVDPLEVELGYGLIPLLDETAGGDLLKRVTLVRRQSALDLGLVVPPVRIRDNVRLKSNEYILKIRGTEVGRGEVHSGQLLAMDPGTAEGGLRGIDTKEPVFGLPAVWIEASERSKAEVQGYTVVEAPAVVATHLSEIVKSHAGDLLSRQDVQKLIDHVKEVDKAVVDELIPNLMTVGGVQKVLQRLLKERLSIRDMVTILESLADNAPLTKDLESLTEGVRQALGRSIVRTYEDSRGVVSVMTVDPALEQQLADQLTAGDRGYELAVDPQIANRVYEAVGRLVPAALAASAHPILLCTHVVRPYLRQLLEPVFPNVVVLSYREVSSASQVKSIGTVRLSDERQDILRAVRS